MSRLCLYPAPKCARSYNGRRSEAGISIVEILTTLTLTGVILGIGILNFRKVEDAGVTGAAELSSFIKQVRARAISSTSAYKLTATTTTYLTTQYAKSCTSATWSSDNRVTLKMPTGASVTSTSWSVCFNSRGFPDANTTIGVRNTAGDLKNVEIMLGGAVRIS